MSGKKSFDSINVYMNNAKYEGIWKKKIKVKKYNWKIKKSKCITYLYINIYVYISLTIFNNFTKLGILFFVLACPEFSVLGRPRTNW
jgi:hypothetical protein